MKMKWCGGRRIVEGIDFFLNVNFLGYKFEIPERF